MPAVSTEPTETDLGRCLRVTATYLDDGPRPLDEDDAGTTAVDESAGRSAESVSANPVQAEDTENVAPMFKDGDADIQGIQTRATIAENAGDLVVVTVITAQDSDGGAETGFGPVPIAAIAITEDTNNAGGVDRLTYTLEGAGCGFLQSRE